ncbi:MAG: amidase [Gemmatimonadetes bacterium]|nr:amidase [Gemmatimonadota bacterium]
MSIVVRMHAAATILFCALDAPAQGAQQTMTGFDVVEVPVPRLASALAAGEVTSVQLVDAYLARIAAYDQDGPALNTIIRLNPRARAEAAALDAERARGAVRGPLHGIPILLKDNFDTHDMPTTAGSIALAGMIPPDDAFQVRRLREAGAVILGKTNLHELAAGTVTISSLGGQTRNPYDPSRNPGGSSGGTGAAIAASFAALGWGSDTCGSIRIPSAYNSLFGLRPTKGLSSTDGVIPLSHTQDVAGPLARTVTDLAAGLDATIGMDPADPATRVLEGRALPRFVASLDATALRGARLGVLRAHFGDAPEDREVADVVDRALENMRALGAEVIDVEIFALDDLLAGSGVIDYELKPDLMDYLAGVPGAPVRSLANILEHGLYHVALGDRLRLRETRGTRDSPEYLEALAKHPALREAVSSALDTNRIDALVYPTARRGPAVIDEPNRGANCQLAASTGFPAISMPAGFTTAGLPVGIELLGRPFDDARLVSLAFAWEQAASPRRPPALTPPLVDGGAPGTIRFETIAGAATGVHVTASFAYDPIRGVLEYALAAGGIASADVLGVTLERGDAARGAGVVYRLAGPGVVPAHGRITLAASQREGLPGGGLVLAAYTVQAPATPLRAVLTVPAR